MQLAWDSRVRRGSRAVSVRSTWQACQVWAPHMSTSCSQLDKRLCKGPPILATHGTHACGRHTERWSSKPPRHLPSTSMPPTKHVRCSKRSLTPSMRLDARSACASDTNAMSVAPSVKCRTRCLARGQGCRRCVCTRLLHHPQSLMRAGGIKHGISRPKLGGCARLNHTPKASSAVAGAVTSALWSRGSTPHRCAW